MQNNGVAKSYHRPVVLYAIAAVLFFTLYTLEGMGLFENYVVTIAFLVAFTIFGLGLFLNHRDGLRRDEMFENLPQKIVDAMDERFPGLRHLPVPEEPEKKDVEKDPGNDPEDDGWTGKAPTDLYRN